MKLKLIAFMLIAGGSAFAQTRWSVHIGGGQGYYSPAQGYYEGPARAYGSYGSGYGGGYSGGAGYWGEDPERQHRRAEWQGLRNHHENERQMFGDSEELREHQQQERWQLRHEQWHERNGDYDAAHGPAHGSARDGMYYHDDERYHQ